MMEITEPRHLLYRCFKCGSLMTSLAIQDKWRKMDGVGSNPPLCPCGSSHFNPGNAKWWEEIIFPSIWKLWYVKVWPTWKARAIEYLRSLYAPKR
jgi:hypothetical protein